MNLYIIADKEAKDDFGYQEIKHYQIFLKESVYKQMLKYELKKPKNWGKFLYSLFLLFLRVFIQSAMLSLSVTFFYFIWSLNQSIELQEVATNALVNFKLFLVIFVLLWFIIRTNLLKHYRYPFTLAANNAFSQAIFERLNQRANELEAMKHEKTI